MQLSRVLSTTEEWQFDSFALNSASGGRPLSALGFALFKRMGLITTFGLNEMKLARQGGEGKGREGKGREVKGWEGKGRA